MIIFDSELVILFKIMMYLAPDHTFPTKMVVVPDGVGVHDIDDYDGLRR